MITSSIQTEKKRGMTKHPNLNRTICILIVMVSSPAPIQTFPKNHHDRYAIPQIPTNSHERRRIKPTPLPRILPSAINLHTRLPILRFPAHVPLHIRDVVKLGNVAILLHVRALVAWHGSDEVLDDFVWDERVAEVEFGDVWLGFR
jgi:hypothetical protein